MTPEIPSRRLLCIAFCAVLLQGCKVDPVIDGTVAHGQPNPQTTLAWSEQGTFTPEGRFFVIGGNQPFSYSATGIVVNGSSFIYEVRKTAEGKYVNLPLVEGRVAGRTCYFGGLASIRHVLYATCTNLTGPMPASVLYRLDTRKPVNDPGRVASVPLGTPAFQPNGIAVDAAGDLYLPNTAAYLASHVLGLPDVPAIVKIKLADGAALSITESGWLPAAFGGFSPNGAAILGQQLYLPSLNMIYRIPILPGGGAGTPSVVYEAPKTRLFDALTVLPGGLIAAPEITNPSPELLQAVYPGTLPETGVTTQVSLIDTRRGKLVGSADFPAHARPSHVTVARGWLFPPGTAIVTDAIGAGGLYLLRE